MEKTYPTRKLNLRDPFVLYENGTYFLYGTDGKTTFTHKPATGFPMYTSTDLERWRGPYFPFRASPAFWGKTDFWAPEVHKYRGGYYLFASFHAPGAMRGTQILRADSPYGPFAPISDGPVTPRDWMCLDGTLVVEPDGRPYIVFCHEWVQVKDGEICAMPLTNDLTAPAGPPQLLFRATDAPWVRPNMPGRYVTDGPFAHRTADGGLLLLWSSFTKGGYCVACAKSQSGTVLGPWVQQEKPLYARDGGHAMLFRRPDGSLWMTLHRPNKTRLERPVFLPVREENGALTVGEPR